MSFSTAVRFMNAGLAITKLYRTWISRSDRRLRFPRHWKKPWDVG